jgi:hypothetical protein
MTASGKASLIRCPRSLFRDFASLFGRKNSLFASVGNLAASG